MRNWRGGYTFARRARELLYGRPTALSAISSTSAGGSAWAQTFNWTVRHRRITRDVGITGSTVDRPPIAVAIDDRPDFLRLGHGVDVLLPGRHGLLQRQLPRAVGLLLRAQAIVAADAAAANAVRAAPAAWRRGVRSMGKTPQEYAAIRARAHHGPAVWAHFHVGHDACVSHPDVCGHPLVIQPNLYHLIRTSGHDILPCSKNARGLKSLSYINM